MAKYKMPAMLPLCLAVLVSQNTMALGLGPASLDSELGEPLFARIPIFRADGLGSEQLLVTLGTVKDSDSGVEIGSVDTRSITAVGQVDLDGNGTIYLRSDRPLVEPFLHFMVNVRWPNGSLSRAYTLLFDPPVNMPANSSLSISALPGNEATSTPSIGRSMPLPAPSRSVSQAEPITANSALYTTVRGDSLWSIALRLAKVKSGSATVWMDRLFVNNPAAFIRGNHNLLKERVTLDLFESKPEPRNTEPSAQKLTPPPAKKPIEVVATSSVGEHNDKLAYDNTILRRREDETGGDNNELAAQSSEGDGVLSEQQFLQQNLGEVRREVGRVSENIAVMTERLAALQDQLVSLNSQYVQLQNNAFGATPSSDRELSAAQTQGNLDEASVGVPIDDNDGLALPVEQGDEQVLLNDAQADSVVKAIEAPPVQQDKGRYWGWLLALAAVGAGLLFWLRRRRVAEEAAFNVDMSDVNTAVAAQVSANEKFGDVFSALDAQTSVASSSNSNRPEPKSAKVGSDTEVFDLPSTANKAPPITANRDEKLLSELEITPENIAKLASDDTLFGTSDSTQRGVIDELELDEELFENLEADADSASELPDLVDFDLSAIDDEWLSETADEDVFGHDDVQAHSDVSLRAAAVLELGDFAGAKSLIENAIAECDDIELKMQLLDILARSGDSEAFEATAIQLEFSATDDEVIREIDSLRALLHDGKQSEIKRRAD